MSKPIRPAYVIFSKKESFFDQKKRKYHKNRINSKYLYSIQPISHKKRINSKYLYSIKPISHKKRINSKYLYSIQPISKNYKFR